MKKDIDKLIEDSRPFLVTTIDLSDPAHPKHLGVETCETIEELEEKATSFKNVFNEVFGEVAVLTRPSKELIQMYRTSK